MDIRHVRTFILKKKLAEERGSQIVETAVFLPVLIVAVLSLAFIMRYMQASDRINEHLIKEAQAACVAAHFIPSSLAAAELLMQAGTLDCEDCRMVQRRVDLKENETMALTADYAVKNRLPLDFIGQRQIRQKIWARIWVGSEKSLCPMTWEDMETEDDYEQVFVFPRAGEKYHNQSCIFVENTPAELMLTRELIKDYAACKTCEAKTAPLYSVVYCFLRAGEVYHIASCPLVDKYVIELEKKEAQEKGYTPCMKCR